MASTERLVKLTVVNDLNCTNCCVGHYELMQAVDYCTNTLHLNIKFDIEFLPFRLISLECLPEDGPKMTTREFLLKKLGEEKFNKMVAAITQWSAQKNVSLLSTFDAGISQSTKAHRLSRKAYQLGGQKLQIPILRAMYKAYCEEGKDIGDLEVLGEIAQSTGVMSKEQTIEFLQSDELHAEVYKLCDNARAKGIGAVPLTVIDGKWALSGGQSAEIFIQIFRKLAEAGNHIPPPTASSHPAAESCEPIECPKEKASTPDSPDSDETA